MNGPDLEPPRHCFGRCNDSKKSKFNSKCAIFLYQFLYKSCVCVSGERRPRAGRTAARREFPERPLAVPELVQQPGVLAHKLRKAEPCIGVPGNNIYIYTYQKDEHRCSSIRRVLRSDECKCHTCESSKTQCPPKSQTCKNSKSSKAQYPPKCQTCKNSKNSKAQCPPKCQTCKNSKNSKNAVSPQESNIGAIFAGF
jgi:hypothetical protein